ncbi:hypothetical protein ACFWBX_08220 [Streptomyces sp. NPDC059991]|uniref:hypothetical protein n=1 Tax=Streptomyces sp. NPDC059991 TaxID=3347028 RepID=UPI0036BD771A
MTTATTLPTSTDPAQVWFARAAPHAPEAAAVPFTASFQATISLGALAGGAAVDHATPSVVMAPGGTVAALATVVIVTAKRPAV